jgi:hypothetical protein
MAQSGSLPEAERKTAMSQRYACILAAGGAVVLAAALGVTTAWAAATTRTWTIHPGGAIHATSARFTFTDTTTGNVTVCRSSAASGTLKSGSGLPGSNVGSLSAVSILTCSGAAGPRYTLHPGGLPWRVNVSSYNAAKSVAHGTVSHIHIALNGTGCTAMIDGTSAAAEDGQATFDYTDSTGQLKVLTTDGNLHFYDVTGCLGVFDSGNPVTLSATYTVTPKQTITSP